MRWWYEAGGEARGPVEYDELRAMIRQGVLQRDSRVIPEGGSHWATVADHQRDLGLGPPAGAYPPAGGYPPAGSPPPGGYGPYPQSYYPAPQPSPYWGPVSDKDYLTTLLLSLLLGQLGVDRFYLGYTGLGVAKLLTFGGCGVWWLIDVILIATGKVPDVDGRPLART